MRIDALNGAGLSSTDTRSLLIGSGIDRLMASTGTLDRFLPDSAFHVVQPGDALSDIAAANGTDWQTLARINGIPDPGQLDIGQRIRLPDAVPPTQIAQQARTPDMTAPAATVQATATTDI